MKDLLSSLNNWQALHTLSNNMLSLAHSGMWDELIEQEMQYVRLVEHVAQNPISPGNVTHYEQARRLLTQVLANEAELRTLLQHRMGELRQLIGQTGLQKSVHHAYGNLSGNIMVPQDINQ